MTAVETLAYNYDLEMKWQFKGYHHTASPVEKKRITRTGFGKKIHDDSFEGCRWCFSYEFPSAWHLYQLRALHCNSQHFEATIKWSLGAQEGVAAAT